MKSRTIKVDLLARVEGEGALLVKLSGNEVLDVKLKIFEPPRLFEAFLRGRSYAEVPDLVARICGICPVAYQMSAVHALEQIFGIRVHPSVRALRRLLYCGEWIESHALHVYLLHAPDFLGYEDGIEMARDHGARVAAGLALKKTGNDLMTLLGGREIHPISVCVGGFYKTPTVGELQAMVEPLRRARDTAVETVRWVAGFEFPDFEPDSEFVALRHPSEYAMNEGRLVSTRGLDIAIDAFGEHFVERHVAHSNALHCVLRERGSYQVGPLARFNLNHEQLSEGARAAAADCRLVAPCRNPFQSIVARAVELVHACEEALEIIERYEPPPAPRAVVQARAGVGHGCTEAPRGILYHRYEVNGEGEVVKAWIVPPTSQNQKRIEDDLREFVPSVAALGDEELTWRCEQMVRNYDPCISCATHSLKTTVVRL